MLCVALSACQSYEPHPLALEAHAARFDDRAPSAEVGDAAIALAWPAIDPARGLTLPDAQAIGLVLNRDLRLLRLASGVSRATWQHAGRIDDPMLLFDAASPYSPSGPLEWGLGLHLTVPVSGRLRAEVQRAGAAHAADLARVVDEEWKTQHAIERAWHAWMIAFEREAMLHEAEASLEPPASVALQRAAAGEMSRIEARLLRAEVSRVAARRHSAALAREQARLEILDLVGLPPTTHVPLVPAEAIAIEPALADVAARLIGHNTELAVRRAEYAEAEHALRAQVRRQYPDISVGGGYGSEDDDRLLLGVSMPIPLFERNRQAIAVADAARALARARAETTLEDLLMRVAAAQADVAAAQHLVDQAAAAIEPWSAGDAPDLTHLLTEGQIDALVLIESIATGIEARERWLDARLMLARAANARSLLCGPQQPIAQDQSPRHAAADMTTSGAHAAPTQENTR